VSVSHARGGRQHTAPPNCPEGVHRALTPPLRVPDGCQGTWRGFGRYGVGRLPFVGRSVIGS